MTVTPNPDRLTALHALCREDYAKGAAQRTRAAHASAHPLGLPDPGELTTAIHVGQRMLALYGDPTGYDVDAYAQAHGGLVAALWILLSAVDAEQNGSSESWTSVMEVQVLAALDAEPVSAMADNPRCPAAHPEDRTPCVGSPVVTVLDAHNAGADGCEHHAARLLASLDGGRVYPLPDAPDGAAIRVFYAAGDLRPFCWIERGEDR